MAKRRNFMVQFNFPVEEAGTFFQQFAPLMKLVENFEITTVEENHNEEQRFRPATGPIVRPGNPTTSEAARERFRMDRRGPSARDIITTAFKGRDSFLLVEAVEAIGKYGLSANTAAPTLNNMRSKGQVEHLDTSKYRLKPEYLKSLNGGDYEGTGATPHTKTI